MDPTRRRTRFVSVALLAGALAAADGSLRATGQDGKDPQYALHQGERALELQQFHDALDAGAERA